MKFTNNEVRQFIAVVSIFVITAMCVPWGLGLSHIEWQELAGVCAPFVGWIAWFFKIRE